MPDKKKAAPIMESKRKPIDTYRAVLGSDKDIVGRGNRTPYEPIPKKETPKNGHNAGGGVTKQMPSSKNMGSMGMAKGGGAERKGKTSTKMVKMAKGGSIDGIAQRGKTRCKGMS